MRKPFVVIGAMMLMAALSCGTAFAERNLEAQKYLQPEYSLLGSSGYGYSYQYNIRMLFDEGYGYDTVLRMVCVPSFENEWLVGIKEDGGVFSVYVLKAGEHIWTTKDLKKVPLEKYSAGIDSTTVELLKDVWGKMVANSRYPENPRIGGHDGTRYHFSAVIKGNREFAGQIWNPDSDTNTGMLVEIGERIAYYAQAAPDKRPKILNSIRTMAEKFKKRLAEDEAEEKQ